jgi:Transposase
MTSGRLHPRYRDGRASHPLYIIWHNMRYRCQNPGCRVWKYLAPGASVFATVGTIVFGLLSKTWGRGRQNIFLIAGRITMVRAIAAGPRGGSKPRIAGTRIAPGRPHKLLIDRSLNCVPDVDQPRGAERKANKNNLVLGLPRVGLGGSVRRVACGGGVEIILGQARRRWSEDEKRALVAETFVDGQTVNGVARRHNISRSMLFGRCKQYCETVGFAAP